MKAVTPPPAPLPDMYALCGNPIAHPEGVNRGTPNITADNTFNSPDGLGFDRAGRLWILTDGKYSNKGDYVGQGNNQMLVGDPVSGEIRRFMVGPKSCELTGITFTRTTRRCSSTCSIREKRATRTSRTTARARVHRC